MARLQFTCQDEVCESNIASGGFLGFRQYEHFALPVACGYYLRLIFQCWIQAIFTEGSVDYEWRDIEVPFEP